MNKFLFPAKDTVLFSGSHTSQFKNQNFGNVPLLSLYSSYQLNEDKEEIFTSRILIQFDLSEINFCDKAVLVLKNCSSIDIAESLNFKAFPITKEWNEGSSSLDIDEITKDDYQTNYASWLKASSEVVWDNPGGDTNISYTVSGSIDKAIDDLEIDITTIVNAWLGETIPNYGLLIYLSDESLEQKKIFFSLQSKKTINHPVLKIYYDDTLEDDRSWFNPSGSNTLVVFNQIFKNLETLDGLEVELRQSLTSSALITGSLAETTSGIFQASFNSFEISSSVNSLFDVWSLNGEEIYTDSISIIRQNIGSAFSKTKYFSLAFPNLSPVFESTMEDYITVFITETYPNEQHIFSKYESKSLPLKNCYWELVHLLTDEKIIEKSEWTRLSNDKYKNFFAFHCSGMPKNTGLYFKIYHDNKLIGSSPVFVVTN